MMDAASLAESCEMVTHPVKRDTQRFCKALRRQVRILFEKDKELFLGSLGVFFTSFLGSLGVFLGSPHLWPIKMLF